MYTHHHAYIYIYTCARVYTRTSSRYWEYEIGSAHVDARRCCSHDTVYTHLPFELPCGHRFLGTTSENRHSSLSNVMHRHYMYISALRVTPPPITQEEQEAAERKRPSKGKHFFENSNCNFFFQGPSQSLHLRDWNTLSLK